VSFVHPYERLTETFRQAAPPAYGRNITLVAHGRIGAAALLHFGCRAHATRRLLVSRNWRGASFAGLDFASAV
jgi:hypothetical protein